MHRSAAKRRVVAAAPQAPIALQAPAGRDDRTRYGAALIGFMRAVAVLWTFEGLAQWQGVLATGPGGLSPFLGLTPLAMGVSVFFAVVDLIGAVGLWLAAPWGGVLWLVAVMAQLAVVGLLPDFFEHPLAVGAADVLLVAGYFALLWLASRAAEPAG